MSVPASVPKRSGRHLLRRFSRSGIRNGDSYSSNSTTSPIFLVLRSSKDRYQILWDTVPGEWDMEGAEAVMRALASRYGGDRAATDVARVMRMPGFRNKKPGRSGALVTWAWHGGPLVRPEDFPGLAGLEPEPSRRSGGRRKMPPGHYSQSERDWAAAGDALRSGEAPETVISRLEQQRQDKPNPGYYARRTVRRKEEELKRGSSG